MIQRRDIPALRTISWTTEKSAGTRTTITEYQVDGHWIRSTELAEELQYRRCGGPDPALGLAHISLTTLEAIENDGLSPYWWDHVPTEE